MRKKLLIHAVTWQDAYSTDDENPLEDINKFMISVGIPVKNDSNCIILATTLNNLAEEIDSPFLVIPKSLIRKVEKFNATVVMGRNKFNYTPNKAGKNNSKGSNRSHKVG